MNDPRRKKLFFFLFSSILLITLLVFLYYFFVLRNEEYTDDAYVTGNMVQLTSQVSGTIVSINTDNTDFVKKGQILIALDPTDYKIALEKSRSSLAIATRQVAEMFQKLETLRNEVRVRESNLLKAAQDYENRVKLVQIGAVSKEEFEHAEAALQSAGALLIAKEHDFLGQDLLVKNTTIKDHPLVKKAADEFREAYVNLSRCKIAAPVDGYIAKRSAQIGEFIQKTKPLLAVIPLNDIWVEANFKETQLSQMRIGQRVKIQSDIYGRQVSYQGKILGIGAGTGSVFSIIPPQNATGNWIKIVQRVPVKVAVDSDQVADFPLRLGMSMQATVDIKNSKGEALARQTEIKPIYSTNVYQTQERGASSEIEEIIEQNL